MREKCVRPDREMGAIEITNLLKIPEWGGVRGEGQHDLAIFTDVLYYLEAGMRFRAQALCAAHQDDLADARAPAEC